MTGNIVTIWIIFDEYTIESDHMEFIQIQGKSLLEETVVDHLVLDPIGPINAKDSREGIQGTKDHK